MERFNYQDLVDHFENSLLTTLRAHSAASELFELWVPDPDVVQSIINMVDNFDFDEHEGFILEIDPVLLPPLRQQELQSLAAGIAQLAITSKEHVVECSFREETT